MYLFSFCSENSLQSLLVILIETHDTNFWVQYLRLFTEGVLQKKWWFWFSDNDIVSPVLCFMPLFSCKQWRAEQKTEGHVNINRKGTIIYEEAASSQ